jgi:hypothetical protein
MNHVERTLATARGTKALSAPPSVDEVDNFENYNDEDSPFFFNGREDFESREETEAYREEREESEEESEDRNNRIEIEKSRNFFFDQKEDKEEILENGNENSALRNLKPLKIVDTREVVYFFTKEIFMEISQNNAYKESTEMKLITGKRRRRKKTTHPPTIVRVCL